MKTYIQPTISIITIENEGIIAQSYRSLSSTQVEVTYGDKTEGIFTVGIGDGGFLNVK